MSVNKKYFYLKFKENYFEQDHIRVIESMTNGYIYSLIILKLYLKSLKFDGQLMINERIPYNAQKVELLAGVLNHDADHVSKAITLAKDLGIMEIMTTGEMFMTDIQNFIGHSSTEAERKALYRKKLEGKKLIGDKNGTMSQNVPPEIELDIELNKDKEEERIKGKPLLEEKDIDNIALPKPPLNEITIDVFRREGQGENENPSAVRATHKPTGIFAECKKYKSKYRNQQEALDLLQTALNNKTDEEEKRKKEKTSAQKEKKKKDVKEVIDYLNEKCGKRFTYSKKTNLVARLDEGYSVDDCKQVIDNKLKDKYFIDNPQYYNPTTLFRPTHFENYLNEVVIKPENTENHLKKYAEEFNPYV